MACGTIARSNAHVGFVPIGPPEPHAQNGRSSGNGSEPLSRTGVLRGKGDMSGPVKRVLIADDHDVIRRGVRALLETRPNFQLVGEAANGRDALSVARETKPDIAILDYSLPELNGYELTVSLKREFPRIEILIYTMYDRESMVLDVRSEERRV